MEKKDFCRWITITGVLVIWTVKWAVRPYFHFNPASTFSLGITPNLLGSFLLPPGANWLLSKYIDLQMTLVLHWFCIVCFCLLVINEYLQLIPFFGRTFDYFDIIASAIGLYLSYWFVGKMGTSKLFNSSLG